jgi:hypothetical protein
MKRKLIKILAIIVSALVLILLIIALAISPVAKSYIEKHSKELIGRKVIMRDLHINIFTGTLEVDSVYMYEANDKDLFASIDTFYLDLTVNKLFAKKIEISELKVVRPYVDILQHGDKFNFDDLKPKKDTSKADTTKSSFSKSIVIKNIVMKGGRLIYTDQILKNTIKMKDLAVSIPEVRFEQGDTKAGIHLKIGDKATLDSHLALNIKTNLYRLNLKLSDLPIDMIRPYIVQYYTVGKLDGLVGGDLLFTGDMDHISSFKISGTASAKGFELTNQSEEPITTIETASVKIENIDWTKSIYLFDFIHASNAKLDFILNPKANNFTRLFKTETKNASASAKASQPMTVKIKDLHIDNSQVTYTDNTLKMPFKLPIRKVDFLVNNFDMNGTNEYKMKGTFPGSGNARLTWKGNMNDFANQQILVNLQNINLSLFTPYCRDYMAYDITSGNMNFSSKNNIRNNNIVSMNILDAYKAGVGKKHKELKAKYNVPLRTALYIMKDKDDKINFVLPVKGNTKDPKFSYSAIIFKTVVNLMVKVALSPFKFLANSLGLKSNNLESITIEPLQTSFSAEQFSQLNDLAAVIKKKPEMILTLTQYVNLPDLMPDYALYKAKSAYIISQQKTENKNPLSYEEVQQVKDNDSQFTDYLNGLIKPGGSINANSSLQEKVNSLYASDSIRMDLRQKLERRNGYLKNYLMTTCEVPEKNLVIKTGDDTTLNNYKDKANYKIEMTLPGSENPADYKEEK